MIFVLLFLLTSCHSQEEVKPSTLYQNINGRDIGKAPYIKEPLYRVKVPTNWIRKDLTEEFSNLDTTLPNVEFLIQEDEHVIRIVVHNFPRKTENSIPPKDQILRWKNQFSSIEPNQMLVIPQAFSGFSGQYMEATGMMNEKMVTLYGWALELSKIHFSSLMVKNKFKHQEMKEDHVTQLTADVTIKAVGSPLLMKKYKKEIYDFAHSFELIDEIPSPL